MKTNPFSLYVQANIDRDFKLALEYGKIGADMSSSLISEIIYCSHRPDCDPRAGYDQDSSSIIDMIPYVTRAVAAYRLSMPALHMGINITKFLANPWHSYTEKEVIACIDDVKHDRKVIEAVHELADVILGAQGLSDYAGSSQIMSSVMAWRAKVGRSLKRGMGLQMISTSSDLDIAVSSMANQYDENMLVSDKDKKVLRDLAHAMNDNKLSDYLEAYADLRRAGLVSYTDGAGPGWDPRDSSQHLDAAVAAVIYQTEYRVLNLDK